MIPTSTFFSYFFIANYVECFSFIIVKALHFPPATQSFTLFYWQSANFVFLSCLFLHISIRLIISGHS